MQLNSEKKIIMSRKIWNIVSEIRSIWFTYFTIIKLIITCKQRRFIKILILHLIQFRNYWEFEFFNSSSGNRNRSTDFIGWDLPPFSGAQRQNGRQTDWIFMKLCWIYSIQTHGLEGREREKKYSQKKRELYNTLEK